MSRRRVCASGLHHIPQPGESANTSPRPGRSLRPRPELYARVDTRIEAMFAAGLLNEVRNLLAKGYSPDLPTMSAIGYRECALVLQGMMSLEDAKMQMRRLTRIFVRRQANWFKAQDAEIHWFEAGEGIVGDIKKGICAFLEKKRVV